MPGSTHRTLELQDLREFQGEGMRLSCVESQTAQAARLTLAGELDLSSVAELDGALHRAAQARELVIVDLRRLEFIDCSGVHLLIRADRRIHYSGGRMVVVRGGEGVGWFFQLMGLEDLLDLVEQPPLPRRPSQGRAQAAADALRRRYPDATQERLAATIGMLDATAAERDEMAARVVALEQELLDLLAQPPAESAPVLRIAGSS